MPEQHVLAEETLQQRSSQWEGEAAARNDKEEEEEKKVFVNQVSDHKICGNFSSCSTSTYDHAKPEHGGKAA